MDCIVDYQPRSYWFEVVSDLADFEPPFDGAPYPCLLWDARGGRSIDELSRLSAALVASGVRYAVCGGVQCKRWHDAIDEAFISLSLDGAEYDARFVMTSWHTDKPADDVAFFFVNNTNFDAHEFTRFLVLQLGDDPSTEQRLREAVREQAVMLGEEEPEENEPDGAV